MSKNYRQHGDVVRCKAPGNISSGDFVRVGNMHGVAQTDASTGEIFSLDTRGIWNLPKVTTETWHEGDYIYWDVSAGKATNAAQTSGDPLIGVATLVVEDGDVMPQNPSTHGDVRLNPSF